MAWQASPSTTPAPTGSRELFALTTDSALVAGLPRYHEALLALSLRPDLDERVRRRIDRLSSAVVDGMLASSRPRPRRSR